VAAIVALIARAWSVCSNHAVSPAATPRAQGPELEEAPILATVAAASVDGRVALGP
jgi:hypothetical protein